MKKILLLILAISALGVVSGQDYVITHEQDTFRCKVVSAPEGKVRINFLANGIRTDSVLDANMVQQVVYDAYTVPKKTDEPKVAMRTTTQGDTIYGDSFYETDSLQYFRHGGITKAVAKEHILPKVSYVNESAVAPSYFKEKLTKKKKLGPTQQGYLGYQIGGLNLVGIDLVYGYPVGFHIGAGFAGYTLGLRIYPIPTNSLNVNLSYKDGGFGLIRVLGAELGGNLVPFGSKGGLHIQAGLGAIAGIDREFSEQLFGRGESPKAMLLLGVGFKIF